MADLPLFDPFKALEEARREGPPELSQKLSQHPAKAIREQEQELNPTFAAFAAFAGPSDGPGFVRTPSLRERERFSPLFSIIYARNESLTDDQAENSPGTPAKAAKAAKETLTRCEVTEKAKTGPAKVSGPLLRKWRDGLTGLSADRSPCPDYRANEWPRVLGNALAFLDTFGAQAEALGWQTHELFGVHPEIGTVRPDYCGALVLGLGGAVRLVTATEIRFGHLTHRKAPHRPQGVPIWDFGQ